MGGLSLALLVAFYFMVPTCGHIVDTWYPACDGGMWWWAGHWIARVLLLLAIVAFLVTVAFSLATLSKRAKLILQALRLLAPEVRREP